jgi:hypothetical protein
MKNFIVGNMGYGGPVVVRYLRQSHPQVDLLLSCQLETCVPFVAVKRSDKVDDLCWDLNWPYSSSLAEMWDSSLLSKVSVMDQNRARMSQDLSARVTVMREQAAMNSIVLDRLLASVWDGSPR